MRATGSSPPWLVTFLLFCSGIGATTAPLVSSQLVKLAGLHASLWGAFAFYSATSVAIGAALSRS